MNLDLRGIRINKCVFENKLGPNSKINLKVDSRTHINIPKIYNKEAVGTVTVRMTVGSPLEALYLYLEQVATFRDSDENGKGEDPDTMMSLFKTICVPIAMQEMEKTISQLCASYHIPEIRLQKNNKSNPNSGNYTS